jgi:rhomboid protease GluP
MKQLILKFKLIFVPFLIITVCAEFVYTILNWLLFVKLEVYNFDDFITSICIPALMTGLAILIWLRPKMKLLNFKKRKSGDPFGGYMMVAWVAAAVPVCIAQSYMVTATGQLTQVDNINQINTVPKTKYYKPAHFYIDKKLVRVKPVFKVTDKGRNFDMYIYAPCPIFDSNHNTQTDTSRLRMPAMFPIPLFVVNGKLTTRINFHKLTKIPCCQSLF